MKILARLLLVLAVRNAKGQSVVEISLITPLLLIALYIPADFGIAFFVANIAGTVARDGARVGSEIGKSGGNEDNRNFILADANTVRDTIVPQLPAYLTNRSVTVNFYEDTTPGCLEVVEVTVSGNYSFFFYQVLRLFGATVTNPKTISRTAQMPYSYQPITNGTRCGSPPVFTHTYSNV